MLTLSPRSSKLSTGSAVADLMLLLQKSSDSYKKLFKDHREPKEPSKPGDDNSQELDAEKGAEPKTQEELLSKIKEKKEVIEQLRCQPWNMHRKRRTLMLAQRYLQQHECKVSKAHLYREEIEKRWKQMHRLFDNTSIYLIPWQTKIKTIESRFGSVVSSYFIFLRWIFWINFIITIMMVVIVVLPEVLADNLTTRLKNPPNSEIYSKRKMMTPEQNRTADMLQVVWDFGGYLEKSPIFYGYYSNETYLLHDIKYRLPLSYLLVNFLILGYSFFAILRKMAMNTRQSKLTGGKTEQYQFTSKIFTGWDYTIGHSETATNTVLANGNKYKEIITEYKTKVKENMSWLLLSRRILANILVTAMIGLSTWAISAAVKNSAEIENDRDASSLAKNQVPIVVSLITLIYPNIFEIISKLLENVHPRTGLRLQLARILTLYLLNFYTLIVALLTKMNKYSMSSEELNSTSRDLVPSPIVGGIFYSTPIVYSNATSSTTNNYSSSSSTNNDTYYYEFTSPQYNSRSISDLLIENVTSYLLTKTSTAVIKLDQASAGLAQLLGPYNITSSVVGSLTGLTYGLPLPFLNMFKQYLHNKTEHKTTTTTPKPKRRGKRRALYENDQFHYAAHLRQVITDFPQAPESTNGNTFEYSIIPDDSVNQNRARKYGPLADDPLKWREIKDRNADSSYQNNDRALIGEHDQVEIVTLPTVQKRPKNAKFRRLNDNEKAGRILAETTTLVRTKILNDQRTSTVYFVDIEQPTTAASLPAPMKLSDEQNACWETMIGQEICKLITMDLVMTIISILFIDFFRGLWARYCNRWWCWNLETVFPEYGEFKVAENVLHLINNQGMIWLGVFFSPLLPAINNVKMIILLHIRAWAVLTCNVPATQIFRASRSSNFYLILLLLMLFLCTLPVVFVLVSRRPSKICGPFGYQSHYFGVLVEGIPDNVKNYLGYVASPGIIIPAIVLLFLIIYFLWSLNRGLKEANQDLQKQLIHERTEEKRKIYEMAGKKNVSSGVGGVRKTPMPEKHKVDSSRLTEHENLQRDPWYKWKLRNVAPNRICVEEEEEVKVFIQPLDDDADSFSGETSVLLNKGAFGRHRQNGGWRAAEKVKKTKSPDDDPKLKSKKQTLISKLSENQAYVPSLRSLPEETDHQTDRELKATSSDRDKKSKGKYISSSTSTSSSNTDTEDISTTLENISEIQPLKKPRLSLPDQQSQPCTSRSVVSFEDTHQSSSMQSQSTWPCSLASGGTGHKKPKKHLLKVPRGRGFGASSSSIDDDEDGRRYTSSPANMQKRSSERPKSVTSDYHTPPSTPTVRKSASAVGGDVASGGVVGRPARSASETLAIQIERETSPSGGSSSSMDGDDDAGRGESSGRRRKSLGRVLDKLKGFLTPMKKLSRSDGSREEKRSRERAEDYSPLSPSDDAWDRAQETFI